jgi:hypothetical protein
LKSNCESRQRDDSRHERISPNEGPTRVRHSAVGRRSMSQSSGVPSAASFTERMARFGPDNPDEARAPLHWPTLAPEVATQEWPALLDWVEDFRERYEAFDEKVLPLCWYQHACYVSALQALRDFERVAYSKSAPGSAGVDWHRALRDIEMLITRWSAGPVACVGGHKERKRVGPVDHEAFSTFLDSNFARRGGRTIADRRPDGEA